MVEKKEPALWMWLLFPAVTMSLGWGLRGYIGGGPLGAMIPGAMIGLALCLLLGREHQAGAVAAFAAIGIGFGGQMTYGQTVGLSLQPETYAWGILGFAVKGAVWGFLGGAFVAIGLVRERFRNSDLMWSFLVMILATQLGWKLLNEPKLIYFSDPINKPRAEIWFGLALGAVALLLYLRRCGAVEVLWRFALWTGLGGGVGFAWGAAIQVWGRTTFPDTRGDWWKMMEFTFGALLGLALGYAAWRNRKELLQGAGEAPVQRPWGDGLVYALVGVVAGVFVEPIVGSRQEFTIVGSVLLCLALASEHFAWQTGVAMTYGAFAYDLLEHRGNFSVPVLTVWFVATTSIVAVVVARKARAWEMFALLTAGAVIDALLKAFLPPWGDRLPTAVMLEFTAMGLVALYLAGRLRRVT